MTNYAWGHSVGKWGLHRKDKIKRISESCQILTKRNTRYQTQQYQTKYVWKWELPWGSSVGLLGESQVGHSGWWGRIKPLCLAHSGREGFPVSSDSSSTSGTSKRSPPTRSSQLYSYVLALKHTGSPAKRQSPTPYVQTIRVPRTQFPLWESWKATKIGEPLN